MLSIMNWLKRIFKPRYIEIKTPETSVEIEEKTEEEKEKEEE